MYINKVKSVLSKDGKLLLRYFDNSGKIKQKKIGLTDTKRNRHKIWREIVPAFEQELKKRAESLETEPKVDARLCIYSDKYREHLKAIKHSKEATHRSRITYIEKYFGADHDMNDITELDIEEFFQSLKCKRSTKLDWLVVMRKIFEIARKGKAIEKNIINDFKLPIENSDDDEGAVVPFSPEEIQALLMHSEGSILHNYLGIAFHLGCRPQEVIALKIEDIDFEDMLVHVVRAITKRKLKKTKTSQSERSVPLPSQAVKFFKDQIAFAKKKKSQFLFCSSNGTRLNDILDIRGRPDRTGPWYALIEKANIPMRAMRQTRHTFAVQAIKSGAYTLQEISAILGHTSLSMLFKHYGKHLGKSHLKVSRSVDIFEGLGDFLGDFDKNSVDDSLGKKV